MCESKLQGEEFARTLYQEHAGTLIAYVQRLVDGDRQLAEDIVQEALLRAWKHADHLPQQAVRPWLMTTARHLVIDLYRARRARPIEASADPIDDIPVADDLDRALDAVLLTDAMRALSQSHRLVLVDCYHRGKTVNQVAAERGLPPGTVRSRLHYALRALRLALQERGVSGP